MIRPPRNVRAHLLRFAAGSALALLTGAALAVATVAAIVRTAP